MQLPLFYVDDLIKAAIKEDIHYLDTTTDLMIPEESRSTAGSWQRRKAWSAGWRWRCGYSSCWTTASPTRCVFPRAAR